jgi:hypothetical protein
MFESTKKMYSRAKCFVFRVPTRERLSVCFDNEFNNIPNPVKRSRHKWDCEKDIEINLDELGILIDMQEMAAKEAPKVINAIKELPDFREYEGREKNMERPKFQVRGKALTKVDSIAAEPDQVAHGPIDDSCKIKYCTCGHPNQCLGIHDPNEPDDPGFKKDQAKYK